MNQKIINVKSGLRLKEIAPKTKFIIIVVLATAISITACHQPETAILVSTDSSVEITVTENLEDVETPSVTPIVYATTTASGVNGAEATTEEDSASGSSGNTSSGYSGNGSSTYGTAPNSSGAASGGSESSGSSSYANGGNSVATSTPEPVATPTTKPTEATATTTSNKYARRACSSCGQQKLVDTPNYRYTTPEKTHEETTETWDYGIQHCEVQINWKSNAKELGDPPSITISFDRKVDTSGKPYDNSAENDATSEAMNKADEWLNEHGVENCSGYYSWQTNKGSTDMINYNKTTTTVVDETEHEYECAAYVCANCGNVETYGTPNQIR